MSYSFSLIFLFLILSSPVLLSCHSLCVCFLLFFFSLYFAYDDDVFVEVDGLFMFVWRVQCYSAFWIAHIPYLEITCIYVFYMCSFVDFYVFFKMLIGNLITVYIWRWRKIRYKEVKRIIKLQIISIVKT